MESPIQITFCVHSYNRLWQLRETLPVNLATIAPYPSVGLEVSDFGSTDGSIDFLFDAGGIEFDQHEPAKFESNGFHMSRSKNIAHRSAPWPDALLFNLDADNFIGEALPPLLLKLLAGRPRVVLHNHEHLDMPGTYGRIGMWREDFEALGGYDESFHPVGYQDVDLLERAKAMGIPVVSVGTKAVAIRNTREQTVEHCGSSLTWKEMWDQNRAASLANIKAGRLVANQAVT